MTLNKAKLLDWIRGQMGPVTKNAIIKRNKELAEYRDWQKAMNSYMAGRRYYNPEVHGSVIARMYGSDEPFFKKWRDEGYPRRPLRERDKDNLNSLRGYMYNEYYPNEYMQDLSYPGSEYIVGVGDDEAAADWALSPKRWNKKEYDRRMKALDDWYEMNFLDPMDLQ